MNDQINRKAWKMGFSKLYGEDSWTKTDTPYIVFVTVNRDLSCRKSEIVASLEHALRGTIARETFYSFTDALEWADDQIN